MNNEEADNVTKSYLNNKPADVNETWLMTGVITTLLFYVTHKSVSLTLCLNRKLGHKVM